MAGSGYAGAVTPPPKSATTAASSASDTTAGAGAVASSRGTQHLTVVPAPGRLSSDHDPPRASLRSRIELSPTWPVGE